MAVSIPMEYPHQMERLVVTKKFVILLASLLGFQCTEPDWHFNIVSMVTCILTAFGLFTLIYTLLRNVKDIFQLLETICCCGVSAPVS